MTQQTEIFQAMARPEFYPQPVTKVEQRETHISKVFLTGDYVYKIKKAVDLEFLDYTSLSKRKFYCQQETLLNRRLSHDIYMGVVAVTLADGRYFLDGPGEVVEYAVKMRQLPEQCAMVASGKSTIATELSRKLGIEVLRSDLIRKDMFDLQPDDFMDVPFEEGIYSKGASSLTYGKLLMLAQEEIAKGVSVILDATFSSEHQRSEALRLARDMDANIIFIECTPPIKVLKDRLLKREADVSVSDARIHHFKQFKNQFEPLEDITDEMHIRIDTQKPVKENMAQILSHDYSLLSKVITAGPKDEL